MKSTRTVLIDDLTGEEADETIVFGLDGSAYEIELTDKNAAQLREVLERYVEVARRISGPRRPAKRTQSTAGRSPAKVDKEQRQTVREWAIANGFAVSDRGRIPEAVYEAWQRAHV